MILQGLNARIFDPIEKYGAKWLQELSRVVWGLLAILHGAPRIQNYDENEAEATRCTDIDSAEEHRLTASIRHARYEQ